MKAFIQKISSRKFQIAATMVIGGLVAMFSESDADQGAALAQKIVGGAMAVLAAFGYMVAEAKVDAARIASEDE